MLLQFNMQVVFPVALFIGLGAVVVAPDDGGGAGRTQVVWQFAARALQSIMQLVTLELCASRIFPAANTLGACAAVAAKTKRKTRAARMTASLSSTLRGGDNTAIHGRAECEPAARSDPGAAPPQRF